MSENEEIITLKEAGESEIVIEKSKFIAHAMPVYSREEAEEFIDAIREEYRDATHNVPAFIVGKHGEQKWSSDDGEPGGSAGAPVLNILESKHIVDAAIVVTRYFGGIKLGVGGLVRAYSGVAEEAVQDAGLAELVEVAVLRCSCGYGEYNTVSRVDFGGGVVVSNPVFTDKVTFTLTIRKENQENVKKRLRSLTNGGIVIESAEMRTTSMDKT
ncbi:MAG: YigZ family protein [Eubacteriales bacterium]|nr:YigZ family protein [Eubacteriales bacterium]